MRRYTKFAALGLLSSAAVQAQAPVGVADPHDAVSADIVVTAPFTRDRADVLSSVSILQGAELTRQIRATIGETLSRQAGVSSTAFGPNASRPVLRGFQGERIRVLTDGIGSFDVSNTSVDHAVVVNPQLAERIEVLRGPAALLFGSSAVGGVVNVLDTRIPRRVPDEAVHIDLLGTYASAANERSGGAVLDVPLSSRLVAHVDASYARSDDLDIGGFVLSSRARAEALSSPEPAANALAGLRGTLPNSAARTDNFAGGVAFIDEGGDLGVAVSRYASLYGVPARFDTATGDGEFVRLDVRQMRVDARASVKFSEDGAFDKLSGRFGYADYEHSEIDPEGNIGTTFLNNSFEGRFELAQARRGAWRGASGVQYMVRAFDAVGDEAFIPRNETTQFGVFTLQELDFGAWRAEGGARYERTTLKTNLAEFRGARNFYDRKFNAYSGSFGASYALAEKLRIGFNLSHTERAPAAEEVLANGPHAGTQSFEIGDRSFGKEKSNGVELVLRARGDGYSFEASGYYNGFKDYIYEDRTGNFEDRLPVFQFRSGRARYYGAEVQAQVTVARFGKVALGVDALADYVDAKLLDGRRIPRIPPFRVLGGATLTGNLGELRIEAEYADRQTQIAAFETPTKGYTLVNASLTAQPFDGHPHLSVVVQANNILDVDARRHASFLKDFAPLPGRDVRVSLRVTY